MRLEEIYAFFASPPKTFLTKEMAVCYVCTVLTGREDSYGTELIKLLDDSVRYALSDTVLYSALKFLEDEEIVVSGWKKVEGRGRPRRMFKLKPEALSQAQELAALWVKETQFTPAPELAVAVAV